MKQGGSVGLNAKTFQEGEHRKAGVVSKGVWGEGGLSWALQGGGEHGLMGAWRVLLSEGRAV